MQLYILLSVSSIPVWSYVYRNVFHSSLSSSSSHAALKLYRRHYDNNMNDDRTFVLLPLYNNNNKNINNNNINNRQDTYDKDDALIPTNDFYQYMERKLRPKHVGIPRKRMDQQFAIQLMRNSYNIVDDLDFVAMDEFQKDFFLFR